MLNQKQKKKETRPFGVRDQIAYFCGDVGGSFINMFVDSYFLVFCTYVLGISAFYMGTLFLVARIWDAINDPLLGSLPDKYLIGKSGDRFKPYIKLFMLPLVLTGVMCFTNVSSWIMVWKCIWISVSYILCEMCYTGTSMPFGSLVSVISNDLVERGKLSRARAFGGGFVSVLLALVPQFIYDKNTNIIPNAFTILAVVCGAFSLLFYTLMLSNTVERVRYETKKEDYNFLEVMSALTKNRPLIGAMIAAMGFLFYGTGSSQLIPYLYKEYYHNTSIITIAMVVSMPIMLIIFPLVPRLIRRLGKKNIVLYPTILSMAVALVLFLVPIKNAFVYMILNMFAIIGPLVYAIICWAMVADCIDYHEYTTGKKADGTVYSIYAFARKLGSALASVFASYSLGWIGYVSGVQNQSQEVAVRIRYLVTAVPLFACILIIIGMGFVYNLSKEDGEKISAELKEGKHLGDE